MNNRLYNLKNAKLNTSQFSENDLHDHVIEQSSLGNIALHVNSGLAHILYKLDDPAILGNLREDGGTELTEGERQSKNFQLYLSISCTVLPPSTYPIAQNLYSYLGDIFAGFDITRGIIRNFSSGDGQTTYQIKNIHGRPSYKMLFFNEYLPHKSPLDRYDFVSKLNQNSAVACTVKGKGSFNRREPSFERGMNELLLKINIASMTCIGATAKDVLQNPEIILKLILIQQTIKMQLGITFPIVIYNNLNIKQTINFLDTNETTIEANKLVSIDVSKTLVAMSEKFPKGIELNFNKKSYSISDINNMRNETEKNEYKSNLYKEFSLKVNDGLKLLTDKLPSYSDEDNIINIHKENKPDAAEIEKYLEINQINLKKFIDEKIFVNGTPCNDETSKLLVKAYNLQFRLFIYDKLLENKSLVNYENINQDLKWLTVVMSKLEDIKLGTHKEYEQGMNPKM